MMPDRTAADEAQPQRRQQEPASPEPPAGYRWYHKMSAVLFITFCLDIGLFLLIFPWTDYWESFAALVQHWRPVWTTCMYAAPSAASGW